MRMEENRTVTKLRFVPLPLSQSDVLHFDEKSFYVIDYVKVSGMIRLRDESDKSIQSYSVKEVRRMFEDSSKVFIDYAE
jgi:hypothetical protein